MDRVGDLVAGKGKREGVVDDKLIWFAKTELEVILVEHFAVQFCSSLTHFYIYKCILLAVALA